MSEAIAHIMEVLIFGGCLEASDVEVCFAQLILSMMTALCSLATTSSNVVAIVVAVAVAGVVVVTASSAGIGIGARVVVVGGGATAATRAASGAAASVDIEGLLLWRWLGDRTSSLLIGCR